MGKNLTIESLVFGMSFSSIAGMWMLLSAGFAAPLWIPVGAIGCGFVALQQVIGEDWFV